MNLICESFNLNGIARGVLHLNLIVSPFAKLLRSRQDSNLRTQWVSDFESDALTTRPRLQLDEMSENNS